jgi:hypothetical protein
MSLPRAPHQATEEAEEPRTPPQPERAERITGAGFIFNTTQQIPDSNVSYIFSDYRSITVMSQVT